MRRTLKQLKLIIETGYKSSSIIGDDYFKDLLYFVEKLQREDERIVSQSPKKKYPF